MRASFSESFMTGGAVVAAATVLAISDTGAVHAREQASDPGVVSDDATGGTRPLTVRRRRRKAVSREMKDLGREQGDEFLGLALGATVGILAASLLSAVWRRSPATARALGSAGVAAATMSALGLWLLTGRVSPVIVGSGIAWLLFATTLLWVFRAPAAAKAKKSLAWLRVPARAGRARGRNGRGGERPAVDEALLRAEAQTDEALVALDRGDVEAALAGLRRSIDLRATKRAHTLLGTMLGARGDGEDALDELGRALELDGAYGEALDEKARILGELGRPEEAASVREKVRPSGPPRSDEAPKVTRRPDLSRFRKRAARATADTPAVWRPAAAFSGAVVAGALLSLVYAAGREYAAARGVIGVLEEAEAGLSSPGDAAAPSVRDLERRRLDIVRGNLFTRDRAASLKAALALHAYGRAKELEGDEAELSRWAARWANRRIAEARAALSAGDRTRLPMGLAKAFSPRREDFEREIERRRRALRRAGDRIRSRPASAVPPREGQERAREWRNIWRRPPPGTTFLIEAFTRTGFTATGEREALGSHRDGSPVAAVGLLRCTVAPARSREEAAAAAEQDKGAFVLLVDSLPYSVESPGDSPGRMPPDVRLVPKEGTGAPRRHSRGVAGPFLIEFGPRLEFRSLTSLAEAKEELIVTRDDLYARREIPFKSLPIFAPGLRATWQEDVSYFRPYEGAGPAFSRPPVIRNGAEPDASSPAVKQVTHWKVTDGVTKMRIGWRTRYTLETREYAEQVVQAWTVGRPWWDFYDDGVLFFRTVFASEERTSRE